jgi:hypothetical protein
MLLSYHTINCLLVCLYARCSTANFINETKDALWSSYKPKYSEMVVMVNNSSRITYYLAQFRSTSLTVRHSAFELQLTWAKIHTCTAINCIVGSAPLYLKLAVVRSFVFCLMAHQHKKAISIKRYK